MGGCFKNIVSKIMEVVNIFFKSGKRNLKELMKLLDVKKPRR
jgi:hypothetical protein